MNLLKSTLTHLATHVIVSNLLLFNYANYSFGLLLPFSTSIIIGNFSSRLHFRNWTKATNCKKLSHSRICHREVNKKYGTSSRCHSSFCCKHMHINMHVNMFLNTQRCLKIDSYIQVTFHWKRKRYILWSQNTFLLFFNSLDKNWISSNSIYYIFLYF